jgi:hypothetical protein
MKPTSYLLYCLALLIMLMPVLTATAYADHEKTIEKTFNVKPHGKLTLDSDLGSVKVFAEDGNSLKVGIHLAANTRDLALAEEMFDDFDVEFAQEGDNVKIHAEYKRINGWRWWGKEKNHLKVEFEVYVPDQYNLDISTGGGSIAAEDVEGDIDVRTSGGSLSFENTKGVIDGKTSGGSINLTRCQGEINIETSGGSINIQGTSGAVYARSSGGSINIDEIMGMIDASTSGGSVSATITGQPRDDCRLTTSGGTVTVYLDENVGFDVDAQTSAGYVQTDFSVKNRERQKKSVLRGHVNDGGPELYLRTSGGNIYLRKI